jgi:DNA modification methylase
LRDYGHDAQIGLEESPEAFIEKLVAVFREVRRVLKPEGTCWVNIGDSYCSTAPGTMSAPLRQDGILKGVTDETSKSRQSKRPKTPEGLKPKDLIGIPWMLAFALRTDGWWLRQDIVWAKPNPMPESVLDRCTKSHEYIFLLTKSQRYYFDSVAIKEPVTASIIARLSQDLESQKGSDRVPGKTNGTMKAVGGRSARDSFKREGSKRETVIPGQSVGTHRPDREESEYDLDTRNKRSVWTVATKPFSEAHFATCPPDLITPCIKAGCPAGGVVLDPFMGAGTTALVARGLGRNYVGFELNPEYIAIAERRLRTKLGPLDALFA